MKPEINGDISLADAANQAIIQARRWADRAACLPTDRAGKLLSDVLASDGGLDFTIDFVDKDIRPEDKRIAARNLRKLSAQKIDFLPVYLSLPANAGGKLATVAPRVVVDAAFRVFRSLVGDLVLDTSPKKLGPAIKAMRKDGSRLNLNLLGEAVLGKNEASRRLNAVMDLLDHDDVDYVSIKVSAVLGVHNPWGYHVAVREAVHGLYPLYEKALRLKKFINLDMEEYHDLHLTIEVFKNLLELPEFQRLEAGIVLQAYLPDALPAMVDLQQWAADRVAHGGAPIKVRLVKGANLPMERVDAIMHGWELATQPSKEAADANYLRILEYALRPEHVANVKIGIAGHNMFSLGFAYALIEARGISSGYEVEMLRGMAPNQAAAVREDVGHILFYVPVVDPSEFDVAISYLVRRLEESAAPENFMSGVFEFPHSDAVFNRERDRYITALHGAFPELSQQFAQASLKAPHDAPQLSYGPNRLQDRRNDDVVIQNSFTNSADSDPSLPANVEWADQIFAHIPETDLGQELADSAQVHTADEVRERISQARASASHWAGLPARERAKILRNAAVILGQRRGELMTVAAAECGKVLGEGDVEVSEAIDFCNYYAQLAEELDQLAGVDVVPAQVTAAIPPWNFPIAIATGSVVAPLATGSAVVFKPAEQARRTGAYVAQALWDAGVPHDVLQLIDIDPSDLPEAGRTLVTETDQTVFTGSSQTAQIFRSWQADLRLFGETSGKNAIIVTEQADIDLAAKDIVTSAFGHAGQKCSACSLVILVGTMAESKRLLTQIVDAARSLVVAYPQTPAAQMGPVIEPVCGKLERGLTKLGHGEHWILAPRQLDDTRRLWSPGIRIGVQRGSEFHKTEYFGPVLGIMFAENLDEAIDIQNDVEYGLTGGIHTLDSDEIAHWLNRVEVGNAYINRGITGAIVRRQPFGGWKRSSVGTGSKAGGPNHLLGLVRAERNNRALMENSRDLPAAQGNDLLIRLHELQSAIEPHRHEIFRAAIQSTNEALSSFYLPAHDVSGLGVEKNILRHKPTCVDVRLEDRENWDLAIVNIVGAVSAGADVTVSVAGELPGSFAVLLYQHGVDVTVESHAAWLSRISDAPAFPSRIRYIGDAPEEVAQAVGGSIDVAIFADPITGQGRVDLRPFFLEQAIAATNHRFGDKTKILDSTL
ncbi:bifunctional proline dehydrogenase/L-glutamate gamma-semialdehyde dehydrogenase [Arcanobacterium phocae]|uniref:bifunctional proline dehydrogenase/L-glutamate gamma-semialdehyde dehydrogenase n=1 Tax=Arcanobacterium phocae TaxID=131112 RepID=UPI001C11B1B8|nr:bifunctional proline dehydrogenase/L-glutamate gamma-semialdehyde dehydrogenase [Arcanobacterium phocae]